MRVCMNAETCKLNVTYEDTPCVHVETLIFDTFSQI